MLDAATRPAIGRPYHTFQGGCTGSTSYDDRPGHGRRCGSHVHSRPADAGAVVRIGTTHPKSDDLSALEPVTKVYASNDGVPPQDRVQGTKHLLPTRTKWVAIRGWNQQFGYYGHQDGKPAITRAAQQAATPLPIPEALRER